MDLIKNTKTENILSELKKYIDNGDFTKIGMFKSFIGDLTAIYNKIKPNIEEAVYNSDGEQIITDEFTISLTKRQTPIYDVNDTILQDLYKAREVIENAITQREKFHKGLSFEGSHVIIEKSINIDSSSFQFPEITWDESGEVIKIGQPHFMTRPSVTFRKNKTK